MSLWREDRKPTSPATTASPTVRFTPSSPAPRRRNLHARSKATPAGTDGHWRIREDRIDDAGKITLRFNSRMHHIRIGRAHKHERVRILIHDHDIRIINPATGELLRELTLGL